MISGIGPSVLGFVNTIAQAAPAAPAAAPAAMPPLRLFMYAAFAVGVLFWGIGRLLELLAVRWYRRSRALVMWYDPDTGGWSEEWLKRRGNEIDTKVAGEPATFILQGKARLAGKWNKWVLHPRNGGNFVGPTDEQALQLDPRLKTLWYSNPFSYRHAIEHNEARDALEANKENEHWLVKVAPLALIALVITVGGVFFLIYKVGQLATAAAAANAKSGAQGQALVLVGALGMGGSRLVLERVKARGEAQ